MIGIISTRPSFTEGLTRALKALKAGEMCSLPPDLGKVRAKLPRALLIFVDNHLHFGSSIVGGAFVFVRSLRCDRELKFRGQIVFLSFAPLDHLKKWPGSDFLSTPGCKVRLLPFQLSELKALLDTADLLSEEEWNRLKRRESCRQLSDALSDLRHRYDNAFTQGLSYLLELEKLSHFSEPDLGKAERAVEALRSTLTAEKLEGFCQEIRELSIADSFRGRVPIELSGLESLEMLEELRRYITLFRTVENNFAEGLPEIFTGAKEARKILKHALDMVSQAKQAIDRESGHG